MTRFWHFTSALHLPHIMEAGTLRTTESNIDPVLPHAGPPVVWLLDEDHSDPDKNGLAGRVDKSEIRFTVDVLESRCRRWVEWAPMNGAEHGWMVALAEAGGGWEYAEHWWVIARSIPRVSDKPGGGRWLAIDRRVGDGWEPIPLPPIASHSHAL
jgi:hypothetical protein